MNDYSYCDTHRVNLIRFTLSYEDIEHDIIHDRKRNTYIVMKNYVAACTSVEKDNRDGSNIFHWTQVTPDINSIMKRSINGCCVKFNKFK